MINDDSKTFDFFQALKYMREGKKVKCCCYVSNIYFILEGNEYFKKIDTSVDGHERAHKFDAEDIIYGKWSLYEEPKPINIYIDGEASNQKNDVYLQFKRHPFDNSILLLTEAMLKPSLIFIDTEKRTFTVKKDAVERLGLTLEINE